MRAGAWDCTQVGWGVYSVGVWDWMCNWMWDGVMGGMWVGHDRRGGVELIRSGHVRFVCRTQLQRSLLFLSGKVRLAL